MNFRVVVPDGCEAGETLRIHISDGTEANVTIPNGLVRGDSFVFEIPTEQMKNPKVFRKQQEQQQQQEQQHQARGGGPNNNTKKQQQQHHHNDNPITEIETQQLSRVDSFKRTTASLVLANKHDDDGVNEADDENSGKNTVNKFGNDNEDHHDESSSSAFASTKVTSDFWLGIAVGLLVGSAIVFGFFMGIVYATETIYAIHPIEKPKQSAQYQKFYQNKQRTSSLPNSEPSHPKATITASRIVETERI